MTDCNSPGAATPDVGPHLSIHQLLEKIVFEVGGAGDPDHVLATLDSLSLVELVVSIETALAIEIPDEMLTDDVFKSLAELASTVANVTETK